LRVGEIAALNRKNFNLKAGTLTFYRPKVNKTQTHELMARPRRVFSGEDRAKAQADYPAKCQTGAPQQPQTGYGKGFCVLQNEVRLMEAVNHRLHNRSHH
jgi:hypothetical protein